MGNASIVGRDPELAMVVAELDRDTAGAVLLLGEAGIGKTAVWQAATELAAQAGRTVLSCRAWAPEGQLSYSALADLLEPITGELTALLPSPQRRALEAALLIAEPDGPVADLRAVGMAVRGVVRSLAQTAPVVIAVDDLAWLDPASAAVLHFALRRLRLAPVLVIATAREAADASDLAEALPTRTVAVGPLSLGALHHIVAAQLGTAPARRVLRRAQEISGGNPLYALELFRAMATDADPDPAALPPSLDALVRSRLQALPPDTVRALFDVAAMAEPASAQVEIDALEPALDAGVIQFVGDRIRFTHPLLAAGAYASLSPPRRREAHARLARVATTVEERARHLALGTADPDEAVATALADAAAAAARRGAAAGAAELLEQAIRLTPGQAQAAQRMLAAADAHLAAGDWSRAQALLRNVLGKGEQPFAADAAARLAGWVLEDVRHGIALCLTALRDVSDDPGLRSRLHAALCANLHLLGDYRRALEHARDAVREAEAARDRRAAAIGLGYLGMFEVILASGEPVAHLQAALELIDAADSLLPVRPRTWLGLRHLYRAELDQADALLLAEHDAALATGDDGQRSAVLLHLCELEWRRGHWSAALCHAEAGYSLAEQVGDRQGRGALLYAVALVTGHLGRVDESRQATAEGLRLAAEVEDRVFPAMHALAAGLLESSLGCAEQALAHFAVIEATFGEPGLEPSIVPYHGDAIEALVSLGRLDEAAARLERLERRARELGRVYALLDAARGRAALLAANGDLGGATDALSAAAELSTGVQAPFAQARLLLARGVVRRRRKQRAAARADLAAAAKLFADLGAAIWLECAHREQARISGRRSGDGALTETERRIAELVASGQSNKEVASALYITVRTVESNLTQIYRKCGVRSRTELARRLPH